MPCVSPRRPSPAPTCASPAATFAKARRCSRPAAASTRRHVAGRGGRDTLKCPCAAARASPSWRRATSSWSRARRRAPIRSSPRTPMASQPSSRASAAQPQILGIAGDDARRASRQDRRGARRRRAGDHRRGLRGRPRPRAPGAGRRRHDARLLEGRDPARQAHAVRAHGRHARAGAARQSRSRASLPPACSWCR